MTNRLFLDIETVPMAGAECFVGPVQAPSNYKDPEKIEAYIAEKTAAQIEKAALDWDLCTIRAIGLANGVDGEPEVIIGKPEYDMLQEFWKRAVDATLLIAGFNVLGFDLPVILRRSMELGIYCPRLDLRRYQISPITDLMQILAGWGSTRYRSLEWYANRYGIHNACPDLDGSMVKEMDDETLKHYLANDISMTQDLYKLMKGVYF